MLPRLLLGALLALLPSATASAATTAAVGPGGVLQITTTAGTENALVVERDPANPVLVREAGTALVAGAGCQDRPDLGGLLCLGVVAVDIDTGDRDDTVTLADAEGFADALPATVSGGDGDDELMAGETGAELSGGQGTDILTGGPGADRLVGGPGGDVLAGADAEDTLDGGDGDDRLTGAGADDALDGGSGDDVLTGGAGHDALTGGAGADRAEYADAAVHTVVVGGDADDAVAADVEAVVGGPVADTLTGGAGAERLAGAEGADTLRGEAGDDVLDGGAGADALDGGVGADALDAGDGDDRVAAFDAARDAVACGPGDDHATVDVVDVVAADCEHVFVAGHPVCPAEAGGASCTPLPCPAGSPAPAEGCPQPPNPCGKATTSARRVLCAPPERLRLTVSARRRQSVRGGVALTVRCTQACSVRARLRGGRIRLASRTRRAHAGRPVALRIRGTRRLVGRRVRVTVTARGARGATATEQLTIRLRR